jgi:glutamyl-tRNA(Gln) amidotransferase subunit E
MMIKTVELEIKRQKKELLSKKKFIAEVRKANEDGTTSFLRPMPGAERMYPETDLPLLKISHNLINEVRNSLPKLREDIRGELKQKGLNDEMIKLVLSSGMLEEFEALLKIYNNSVFVAKVLFLMPREIASHFKVGESIFSVDIIETILQSVSDKKILEEDVKRVMEKIAKNIPVSEALKVEKKDIGEIESEIAKIIKEKPGLSIGAYMGLVMAKFKGKVGGKDVSDILGKLIK